MTRWVCFGSFLSLLLSLLGCQANQSRKEEGPIRAVVTVGMIADLVRIIGGEQVRVEQLMGTGVDPHLYRSTRDDAILLRDATIVFYCGLKLEGKMSDAFDRRDRHRPAIAVTSALPAEQILHPEGSDHADPHVWMNVLMWKSAAEVIAQSLIELRPEKKSEFEQRLAALLQKMDRLDAYGMELLSSIPESKRVLITSHDAFQYFGKRYGIEVQGIQGISTDSEAGIQHIQTMVATIVTRKIEAVFVESSVPRDGVEALVRGAADRGQAIKVGGPLYSDSMGEAGTYEGTYEGMMAHNFEVITKFLGGMVPEGGFRGQQP